MCNRLQDGVDQGQCGPFGLGEIGGVTPGGDCRDPFGGFDNRITAIDILSDHDRLARLDLTAVPGMKRTGNPHMLPSHRPGARLPRSRCATAEPIRQVAGGGRVPLF